MNWEAFWQVQKTMTKFMEISTSKKSEEEFVTKQVIL